MENVLLVPAGELTRLGELVKNEGAGPAIKNIYGYILASGAVREDVYSYLTANPEYEPYSVQYINELIKFFAPPEWFDLIRNAEHKSDKGEVICRLYQQSILNAFKEGLHPEETGERLNNASYPYELDSWIAEKRKKPSGVERKDVGNNPEMPATGLTELMTMVEAVTGRFDEICSRHEEMLLKIFSELIRRQEMLQNEIIDGKTTGDVAGRSNADGRHPAAVTDDTEENHSHPESAGAALQNEMSPESGDEAASSEAVLPVGYNETAGDMPDKQTGDVKSVLNTAKKINTDSAVSIGHIFQRIRNRKHKSEFLKLSDGKKIEELFMLIRRSGYDNELIGKVRKCLEDGVTCEFLYVFIESGADGNDFDNLITFIKKKEERK